MANLGLGVPDTGAADYIDIVFDGPPSHESGRFVEVENAAGASINFGQWVQRPDGYWVLRIASEARLIAERDGEREARHRAEAALRSKDAAMQVLFDRLRAAGDDCSDLIP